MASTGGRSDLPMRTVALEASISQAVQKPTGPPPSLPFHEDVSDDADAAVAESSTPNAAAHRTERVDDNTVIDMEMAAIERQQQEASEILRHRPGPIDLTGLPPPVNAPRHPFHAYAVDTDQEEEADEHRSTGYKPSPLAQSGTDTTRQESHELRRRASAPDDNHNKHNNKHKDTMTSGAGHSERDHDHDEDDEDDDDDHSVSTRASRPHRTAIERLSVWYKLSPFMRYMIIGAVGAVLFIIPAILIATLADVSNEELGSTVLYTKYVAVDWLTWIGFMWFISMFTHFCIDRVPRVIVKLSHIIWGVCSERVKWRIEYFISVKQYSKILIFSSWAWGSFAFTHNVFPSTKYHPFDGTGKEDKDGHLYYDDDYLPSYYYIMSRIFMALFLGALLLLIEKMCVQIIGIRFHRTAYRDRIRQNKKEIRVLDNLSDGARQLRRNSMTQFPFLGAAWSTPGTQTPARLGALATGSSEPVAGRPRADSDAASTGTNTPRGGRRTPLQAPHFIGALNRKLQYITMADAPREQDNRADLNSSYQARKMARWLYDALSDGERRELTVDDFYRCFKTDREVKEAFAIFDRDGNGDVSRREMRDAVLRVYKERKDLAGSLRDMSQCVGKLDNIFMALALIIYIFMVLNIVSGKAVAATLVPFGSLLVALSFIFGQSAKNTFDSIIFVFVTHPYDTGDTVNVDNLTLTVQNVGLLTTTFCRADGQVMYAPNIVLASKYIYNARRSGNTGETVEFQVDFYTAPEKIHELTRRLEHFLETHMARDFVTKLNINVAAIINTNRLNLTVYLEHKSNWQDGSRRWQRRTKFMLALKEIITELDMRYYLPPQRVEYLPPYSPPADQPWAPYPADASGTRGAGPAGSGTGGDRPDNHHEMARQVLAMDTVM